MFSAIDSSNSFVSCVTTPTRDRQAAGSKSRRSVPLTVTAPCVGSKKRGSNFQYKVLLPDPFSPTTATTSPAGIASVTPSSTSPRSAPA